MSRTLSKREKGILAAVIILLIGVLAIKGGYLPLKDYQDSLQEQIARAEGQLHRYYRVIQKGKIYEQRYGQWLKQFEKTDSDEKMMSKMIAEIESVAEQLNISLSDMKPQRVRHEDLTDVFSVSLILDGQFVMIMEFLHMLQGAPHLFLVEEMRIEKKSFNSSDLRCYLVLNRLLVQP